MMMMMMMMMGHQNGTNKSPRVCTSSK